MNGHNQISRPYISGVGRGNREPVRIATSNANRRAVQVFTNDAHLAPDAVAFEWLVRATWSGH